MGKGKLSYFSAMILVISVFSIVNIEPADAAFGCPSFADTKEEFESVARTALLTFLANPQASKINARELSDLSGFYERYKDSFNNANCEEVGGASNQQIKVILGKYGVGESGSACVITERKWSAGETIIDNNIELIVKADGFCSGKRMYFAIKQSGLVSSREIVKLDNVFTLENNVWVAKVNWKALRADNPNADDPYYYYQTGFANNAIDDVKSELLRVRYCKDEDKDGFRDAACLPIAGSDCNDNPVNGKSVYPGAADICNNIDDDCDGAKDENLLQCACTVQPPVEGQNHYTSNNDVCDNWDNNCNGVVDEGLAELQEGGIAMCRANLDGQLPACIGVTDYVQFLRAYKSCKPNNAGGCEVAAPSGELYNPRTWNAKADLNGDKLVNLDDFFLFAPVFSGTCPGDLKCDSYCNANPSRCVNIDTNGDGFGDELRMKDSCGGNVNGAIGECGKGDLVCLSGVFVYNPNNPVDANSNPYIGLDWYRDNPDVFDILCKQSGDTQLKPVSEICDNKDNDCNGVEDDGATALQQFSPPNVNPAKKWNELKGSTTPVSPALQCYRDPTTSQDLILTSNTPASSTQCVNTGTFKCKADNSDVECYKGVSSGGAEIPAFKADTFSCSSDDNSCTNDLCDGFGLCAHTNRDAGASCASDSNACTSDTCSANGRCLNTLIDFGTDGYVYCQETISASTQWRSNGFCQDKKQVCKKWRDYSCDPSSGSSYTDGPEEWFDVSPLETRNLHQGDDCLSSLTASQKCQEFNPGEYYETTSATCSNGLCSPTQNGLRQCNYGCNSAGHCVCGDGCKTGGTNDNPVCVNSGNRFGTTANPNLNICCSGQALTCDSTRINPLQRQCGASGGYYCYNFPNSGVYIWEVFTGSSTPPPSGGTGGGTTNTCSYADNTLFGTNNEKICCSGTAHTCNEDLDLTWKCSGTNGPYLCSQIDNVRAWRTATGGGGGTPSETCSNSIDRLIKEYVSRFSPPEYTYSTSGDAACSPSRGYSRCNKIMYQSADSSWHDTTQYTCSTPSTSLSVSSDTKTWGAACCTSA